PDLFTALSALSAGAGFALALLAWSAPLACAALILTPILVMAHLHLTHARANRLAARLVAYWQHGPVPLELEERHARLSLEATTADVSVIVTMAAALFAGAFSAMTNLGGIPSSLESAVPVAWIKDHGLAALSAYTTLSLLLSARMVIRLRLALAEHSSALARLRKETDDAWRFRVEERTFLLHLLVALLVAFSGTILVWTLGDALVGITTGVALGIVSVLSYPISLARERRRAEGKERKDSDDKATESAEAETVAEGTD